MSEYRTYYLVDGVRMSYETMRKLVGRGKTGVEVSAVQQQVAFEERIRRARENAILDAEIRRAAARRAHEQSPEGMRQAASRTATQNPGGIVSGVPNPVLEELNLYSPEATNPFK